MKLFGRTSGYYLFWTGFVYFWAGMYFAFTHAAPVEYATLGFMLTLSVPLLFPPVARYFNMEPMMFDFFKKRDYSNVVKFPVPTVVPDTPYIEPPSPKPEPKTYYTFGLTNDNRVSFTMGYTTLTMNEVGIQQLIDQLEFFQSQLREETDS
jgi:hypothetical protein